jgi:predicted ester cyclase
MIDDLIAEGDKVVARLTYTGTHKGPIFGIEVTGRRTFYGGVDIFKFAEAKIKKIWVLGDLYSLLKQISAIAIKVG